MQYEENGGSKTNDVKRTRFGEGRRQEIDNKPLALEKQGDCGMKESTAFCENTRTTIVCVPPSVTFVNFEVGKLYTQRIRIINKSPTKVGISIKPTSSTALHVELCSKLVIMAGGDAAVKVHFKPEELLPVQDEVIIRVTEGQDLRIPIACCIEHPVLNVVVYDSAARCEDNGIYIGATLLGNTLRVPITFHSDTHARFIIISNESWSDFSSDTTDALHMISKDKDGNYVSSSDCFTISPSCFSSGTTPAMVVCCPPAVGFHVVLFRILCSTAVVRSLRLVADAVMYKPHHIRLKADERDYDILTGEEDPACEYYLNLGRTTPGGELMRTIRLENVSPVPYKYYWSVRPWCSRGETELNHHTCCEVKSATLSPHLYAKPSRGTLHQGSSIPVEVYHHCAGHTMGTQRSVLMLILTDIPIESLSPGINIVKKYCIDEEEIPGLAKKRSREVCDVVSAQLEVWWELVPVVCVLHPPCLDMRFSRRVQSVPLDLYITELQGLAGVQATWDSPLVPGPAPLSLVPAGTTTATVVLPLQDGTDDVDIRLRTDDGSCAASAHIEYFPEPQHPALSPAYVWAGVVPPNGTVTAQLVLSNYTHRVLHWRILIFDCGKDTVARTQHTRGESLDCVVNPSLGTLEVDEQVTLKFKTKAPKIQGWTASLVQVCTDAGDVTRCAALIAYRVLEPRLVLRVISDAGFNEDSIKLLTHDLIPRGGSAVLRPPSPLSAGHSTRYRLRVTNTTAVPTVLRWETAEDKDEPLRAVFLPNIVEVGGYETVDVTVTLMAQRVCSRRIFVYPASVQHTSTPVYLPIVTSIAGIQVHIEIPIRNETPLTITLTEPPAEVFPRDMLARTMEEFYRTGRVTVNDRRECTQVSRKPGGRSCLEFIGVHENKISFKTLVIRNVSHSDAVVVLVVRRWPRRREARTYPDQDQWTLHGCGVAVDCAPWQGVLRAGERGEVRVAVLGDTWGVYRDRLLLLVENQEPLVVDLWVEVVGAPLKFVTTSMSSLPPAVWLSSMDPEHFLRAMNSTQADIHVYTFVVKERAITEKKLPFRLYVRLYEVSAACLCTKDAGGSDMTSSNNCIHTDLGVELFLYNDCGRQDSSCYRVEPDYVIVEKQQTVQWKISLLENSAVPLSSLVVRSMPVQEYGEDWYRPPLPPQLVRLRTHARTPRLEVSESELTVEICALDLCPNIIKRTRRLIEIKNTGNAPLPLVMKTKGPWHLTVLDACTSSAQSKEDEVQRLENGSTIKMVMQPDSSREVLVELDIEAKQVSPKPGNQYESYLLAITPLFFYDNAGEEMLNIPLIMHVDRPILIAEPSLIDFGLVSDGYAKKTYFTIRHTSRTKTIELRVYAEGDRHFKLYPEQLTLAPGESKNVFLQYTCEWVGQSTACAVVRVRAGGVDWCAVSVQARARPTRHVPRLVALEHSDFTVDTELLPPVLWD